MKIGRIKALKSHYDALIRSHDIKMAEHFRSSIRGSKTRYYGFRLIKSRFGESYVDKFFQGGVRSCDNAEAKAFYNEQAEKSIKQIVGAINEGDLERAKKTKRKLVREGKLL